MDDSDQTRVDPALRELVDPAFIELVRKAYITEYLSLPEDVIIRIAGYLFIFQNNKAQESLLRDSSKQDRQNRLVSPLLNSAKKVSELLDECLRDPVLGPRLLEAYKQTGYVDKLHVSAAPFPYYVDVYEKRISAGDNPEEELLNLVGKLMLLEKAVSSIAPKPSPFPSNKTAQIPVSELVRVLDGVLAPYVSETCSKLDRARHVADYISLIDLYPSEKTIMNHLL